MSSVQGPDSDDMALVCTMSVHSCWNLWMSKGMAGGSWGSNMVKLHARQCQQQIADSAQQLI